MGKQNCYLCCTIFTFSGFIFTIIIGAILKLQPMFVHNAKNPKKSANACFEAGALYAFCFVCLYVLWVRERRRAMDLSLLEEQAMEKDTSYREVRDDEQLPLKADMSPAERTFSFASPSASPRSRLNV
ncbi:TPA: hypothetical protein N0F65_006961 [Lagenidium giganteum]|uniref:Uncharacterized protein n=1 Tax=Lagenidium giganteum TaxID=4803 RepID=A0AAV2ZH99_9STRA|nr:TPA: hypothetical protein N0F65_006961 [Lagenidium giganteum]